MRRKCKLLKKMFGWIEDKFNMGYMLTPVHLDLWDDTGTWVFRVYIFGVVVFSMRKW